MLPARTVVLTSLAMLAFAGNSVLCRVALAQTGIDPASFTSIRLASGAVVLWLVVRLTRQGQSGGGSWGSALALFGYAACFSFAYVSLTAATGALLLFGAVQATMIGHGLRAGARFTRWAGAGLVLFGKADAMEQAEKKVAGGAPGLALHKADKLIYASSRITSSIPRNCSTRARSLRVSR